MPSMRLHYMKEVGPYTVVAVTAFIGYKFLTTPCYGLATHAFAITAYSLTLAPVEAVIISAIWAVYDGYYVGSRIVTIGEKIDELEVRQDLAGKSIAKIEQDQAVINEIESFFNVKYTFLYPALLPSTNYTDTREDNIVKADGVLVSFIAPVKTPNGMMLREISIVVDNPFPKTLVQLETQMSFDPIQSDWAFPSFSTIHSLIERMTTLELTICNVEQMLQTATFNLEVKKILIKPILDHFVANNFLAGPPVMHLQLPAPESEKNDVLKEFVAGEIVGKVHDNNTTALEVCMKN